MNQKSPLKNLRDQVRQLIWNISQRDFAATRPPLSIRNPERHRRVRLFLSLAILYAIIIVPVTLLRVTFQEGYAIRGDPFLLGLGVALFGYGLGRTQHYQIGTPVALSAVSMLIFSTFLIDHDLNTSQIAYLVILLSINGMLGSMLLSTFHTAILLAAHQLAVGGLVLLSNITAGEVFSSFVFLLVLNSFVLTKKLLSQRDLQQIIDQSHDLVMSQHRFETVVENLHEGLLITDIEDTVLYVNKRMMQLTGYSREEFLGNKAYDLLLDVEEHGEMLERNTRRSSGVSETYEIYQRRKDGSTFLAEINGIPYYDLDGNVIGTIGVISDITKRREIERENLEMHVRQEKSQLVRDLIGALSHDLKTPLSVINTNLYLLGQSPNDEVRENRLTMLKQQSERLEKLIESILTSYRLDSTHRPPFTEVDISELINACLERFESVAQTKGIRLCTDLAPNCPPIMGDEFSLDRAIDNLLQNACNYTLSEGTVTISTEFDANHVFIRFIDSGIGIAEADISRVFEHFFRADEARNSMRGGTGLGLSIVKQIVGIHHGSIDVESKLGKGTTFIMKLPINTDFLNQ